MKLVFISDLHLSEKTPSTNEGFFKFLKTDTELELTYTSKLGWLHPDILGIRWYKNRLGCGIRILKESDGRGWMPSVSVPAPGVLNNQ